MTLEMTTYISIDLIDTTGRLRQSDPNRVAVLQESMSEVGLLNPITVVCPKTFSNMVGYKLIAGGHRLEAARALGWEKIQATILKLSDEQQIIAECDENLCINTLSAVDRAMFTAKRKMAYEALHPETKNGTNQHSLRVRKVCEPSQEPEQERFTANTAAQTGKSERSVQLDAERGVSITPDALNMVRGTKLDRGTFLDKLKNVSPESQVEFVQHALDPDTQDGARDDPKPDEGEEELDPYPKLRAEYRKLTPEGAEEGWIELRLAYDDHKAVIKRQKSEIADLKSRIEILTSDDDTARKLANALRECTKAEARSKEHQANVARLQLRVNLQQHEIKKLRASLENREIML